MVLERYSAVQTVCFCGAFPEIGRAWATVDNSLFLWRFDRWCARVSPPSDRSLAGGIPPMFREDLGGQKWA